MAVENEPNTSQCVPPPSSHPKETEPVNAPAAARASKQQLTQVEEQMSAFERSTLRWAKTAVTMSGLAAIFVCLQWWEMHTGSVDTHNLAVASGSQATWTQHLSDNMMIQSDRTQELADRMKDQADQTRTIADQAMTQAKEAEVSAGAAKSAAETAKEALHVSEKAYVVTGAPVLQLDTDVVDLPVSNRGHIPSGSLRIVVHEATLDVEPTARPGIIQPTEQHWQHYDVTSIPPSNGADYSINTPVQAVVASKILSGHQQIIIAGTITYNDGFPDTPEQTWLFCDAGLYWEKLKKVQWMPCDPVAYIKQLTNGDHYPNNEYIGQ